MSANPELVFQARIDLSGIWGRVVRVLEVAQNNVAIGLFAAQKMTPEWLQLPSDSMQMQYNGGKPLPFEVTREYWQTWVLTGGFRDVAETLSETLEEVQKVLALWYLLPPNLEANGAKVPLARVQEMERENQRFHKRGLPDKLDWLAVQFEFAFPADMQAELVSINAARNCFVHRAGIVGDADLDKGKSTFSLKWRSLNPYVQDGSGERPLKLPLETSKTEETRLILKVESAIKEFSINTKLQLSADEFAGIAWTQLSASQWAAQRLEEIGRSRGFDIHIPEVMT